jgi:hypothetical protein
LYSRFLSKMLYAFIAIRATCSVHLVHLKLMALIILGEEHKLLSPSLCNFLHLPVTCLLDPNILLSTHSLPRTRYVVLKPVLFPLTLLVCNAVERNLTVPSLDTWS